MLVLQCNVTYAERTTFQTGEIISVSEELSVTEMLSQPQHQTVNCEREA